MNKKKRLDLLLVEKGLARSRAHAQDLIEKKMVVVDLIETGKKPLKSSQEFLESVEIKILPGQELDVVSRAGLKLSKAIEYLKISLKDKTVLDVGQSTGGFTQVALENGAKQVVGIDSGHSQLSNFLRTDPRVLSFEKINARSLSQYVDFISVVPSGGFEIILIDVSFISQSLILPEVSRYLCNQGTILSLVKPQFELGRNSLQNKTSKDWALSANLAKDKLLPVWLELDLELKEFFPSSILGRDGNQEYFAYLQKSR